MVKLSSNFSKMNLAALVRLREQVERALNERIAVERKELEAKIAELGTLGRGGSNANGQSLRRTRAPRKVALSRKPKRHPLKGRKAEAKYRSPAGDTWAGRGLAPRWLTDLEKKGKKREQFSIVR
jgi:DNA-binding protein H-NS